jgi:hypothetical protein
MIENRTMTPMVAKMPKNIFFIVRPFKHQCG